MGQNPEALAAFVQSNRAPIRARFRAGLNPALQHLLETGDILSTVFRRTQRYLYAHELRHQSSGGLWRLIEVITSRAAADHARQRSATRRAELAWRERRQGAPTQALADRPPMDLLSRIADPVDRQIARLRAEGKTHTQIGAALGLTDAQARQRWSRLCQSIHCIPVQGGNHDSSSA